MHGLFSNAKKPRVVEVRATRYAFPLIIPITTTGRPTLREVLVVGLALDDGSEGYAEISPLPGLSLETLDEASADAERFARRLVETEVAASPEAFDDLLPSTAWGLFCALEGARAASEGWLLGARWAMRLGALLDTTRPAVCGLATAGDALIPPVGTLKLKVGRGDVDAECRLVRDLVETRPDLSLRLDGNRKLDAAATVALARAAGERLAFFEEPMADVAEMIALFERHRIPLALDETLALDDEVTARMSRAVVAFVLKPTVLGPSRTFSLAMEAKERELDIVISSAFEGPVGLMVLAHLGAAAAPEVACGLGTARYLPPRALPEAFADEGFIDLVSPHPRSALKSAAPVWRAVRRGTT